MFSSKLDGSLWRNRITIKSNSYITFNIRSNKDLKQSSSFFLKFKVTAYGYDKLSSRIQFNDLTLLLTTLVGLHFGRVYLQRSLESESTKTSCHKENDHTQTTTKLTNETSSGDNKQFMLVGYQHQLSVASSMQSLNNTLDTDKNLLVNDLNSNFYRVLFRGGFNKLNVYSHDQVSIQHYCQLNENNQDHLLLEFLNGLNNYFSLIKTVDINSEDALAALEAKTEKFREFMKLYDQNFETEKKVLVQSKTKIGGMNVTELIIRIFSALIWHNSSIEYNDLFDESDKPKFNDLVARVYKTAESSRMFIVEQQQVYKAENASKNDNSKSLLDTLNEKAMYLLKFERIPDHLVKHELRVNSRQTSQNLNSKVATDRVSLKRSNANFMKSELYPSYNLIFDFIFQTNMSCLSPVTKILDFKRKSAILINQNFKTVLSHLRSIFDSKQSKTENDTFAIEKILTFLSNFFSTSASNPISSSTKSTSGSKSKTKAKINFPPLLKFNLNHFLDDLYACGLDHEQNVKKDYFELVKLLLDYSNRLKESSRNDDSIQSLLIRFNCYLTSLLNIDWQEDDWEFVKEANLIDYLLENAASQIPISYYKDMSGRVNSEVLEDAFDLRRSVFMKLLAAKATNNSAKDSQTNTKEDANAASKSEEDVIKDFLVFQQAFLQPKKPDDKGNLIFGYFLTSANNLLEYSHCL
jgi:hypothetical protein